MPTKHLWLSVLFSLSVTAQSGPTREIVFPALKSRVEPAYTEQARDAELQGTVTLAAAIGPDGIPRRVKVLHGLGLGLDESAVQAVGQWRYAAATIAGIPSEILQSIDVDFTLPSANPWHISGAAYSVDVGKRSESEAPVLLEYGPPDPVACPANGASVAVQFQVDATGKPERIKGNAAVIKTIESWRFRPADVDGKPKKSDAFIELQCGPKHPIAPPEIPTPKPEVFPVALWKPEPTYSTAAKRAKVKGEVWLSAVIGTDGRAWDVRVIQPMGYGLDEQAVGAVKSWRFQPGNTGGAPVNSVVTIAINFRLI